MSQTKGRKTYKNRIVTLNFLNHLQRGFVQMNIFGAPDLDWIGHEPAITWMN